MKIQPSPSRLKVESLGWVRALKSEARADLSPPNPPQCLSFALLPTTTPAIAKRFDLRLGTVAAYYEDRQKGSGYFLLILCLFGRLHGLRCFIKKFRVSTKLSTTRTYSLMSFNIPASLQHSYEEETLWSEIKWKRGMIRQT